MAKTNNHDQLKQDNESLKQQVAQYQNKEQVTNVEIYNLNQHIMELERTKADLQVTVTMAQQQLKQTQETSTNK
ncbi:hypothetical protein [Pediococcus ethanolidurans]|uniref:Uncharacterized protein n=1 Tax=Pediococcus ethanolidurans TaxID=319653 RepID=A0A0R2K017_9LACO|nr:hypothetical protein [Pediococcus ethanolidurans]KRN82905.1 hypothetical protein IV87_GL001859 [Pediococcus ethanolidurans]GEN94680.1 hypothetical protein PET01_07300 [Pediococcus ethanolidurans]SER17292.1 hypothetical protein SAMN04487973_102137 [Pediococcus ethanolidurans]